MKNNYKQIARGAVASLIAATIGQSVSAAEFPYIAPEYCPNSIVTSPVGASPFYRSESCKTIYVLPPQEGSLDYTMTASSSNDAECDDLRKLDGNKRVLYEKQKKIEEVAFKPGVPKDELEGYEKQLDMVDKQIGRLDKAIKVLAGYEGGKMAVALASNLPEEVNRFQFLNQLLFAQGTRFEPTPVSESYVSFDVGSEKGDTRPAVLSTNIPSIKVRGVESAPQSDSRIMNGSVKGKVVLGLNAICNMRENQGVKHIRDIDFSPKEMEAHMPANLTFSVPVMSSYMYEASMDMSAVVSDLYKQWEIKPDKFNVNQFAKELMSGTLSTHTKWKFQAYELQNRGVTPESLKELEEREKGAVFAEWARQVADAMTQLGILKKEAPVRIPAPEAGTEAETFYRRVCQSKRFLGIRYDHRCWDEPYTVLRVKAGEAQQTVESIKNLKIKFSESVSYSQPIYRTHTSTFTYKRN